MRIGDRWVAVDVPAHRHGTRSVANYHGCECNPCRRSVINNKPERRAELRREWKARRELVNGEWVATHLPARQHGTPSASDYYCCECPVCTEAKRRRRK